MGSRSFLRYARKDPELYGLVAAVGTMLGVAGWYAGHRTTNIDPERKFAMNSMPWQQDDHNNVQAYKYKYHKDGDQRKEIINAPHAMSSKTVHVKVSDDIHRKFSKHQQH